MDGVFRTPEERFDGLWGEVAYAEVDGLRIARHDEGAGPPVVFFHGEPTWSYLWREVIPPVREAGHRCIAPDLPGFGRSDKPLDLDWYTYDRHVAVMAGLLEPLGLRGGTAVVHDWGGPIGLRLAVEHPGWFDRLVILDTGLFTGRQAMSDAWRAFRDFVEREDRVTVRPEAERRSIVGAERVEDASPRRGARCVRAGGQHQRERAGARLRRGRRERRVVGGGVRVAQPASACA